MKSRGGGERDVRQKYKESKKRESVKKDILIHKKGGCAQEGKKKKQIPYYDFMRPYRYAMYFKSHSQRQEKHILNATGWLLYS